MRFYKAVVQPAFSLGGWVEIMVAPPMMNLLRELTKHLTIRAEAAILRTGIKCEFIGLC
jgi:hypothetical protein